MKNIKKLICMVLVVVTMVCTLTACGNSKPVVDETGAAKISFATSSLQDVVALKDQKVAITGYMSLLSPLDGKLIYLVNLPMQNCPFCEQNSKQLSTSMAVVLEKPIEDITLDPVKIVGTLKVGEYTDEYGYQYMYRIEDATYEVVDENSLPNGYDVYYTLAANDDIYNLYFMLSYVDFYIYYDYYELTASQILAEEKVNVEDYGYTSSIERVKSYNDDRYEPFIKMMEKCKELEIKINECLDNENAEGLRKMQSEVDKLYEEFNKFITKYST